MPETRRHAAIMFTDIVGYTQLMGSDEEKAVDMLSRNRSVHQSCIEKFNGTLIKEIGDGILASFSLASEAVRCAIEIQKESKEQGIPLKIGIHEGEMIFSGSDVIGDGVNIASRLQEDAQEGCINISAAVYSNIRNKPDLQTTLIGERSYKNVGEPIRIYTIQSEEDSGNQGTKSWKQQRHRRGLAYYILAGLAIILVAILVIWKFIPFRKHVELEKTIAVLPFENLSEEKQNQYTCDGIMEAILNHLQKIEGLTVISRTSVEKYREHALTIPEIAEQLKVNYIIEGSVQKIDNSLRITVQLIRGNDDSHLWSDQYDEEFIELKELFTIQSNIAKSVANELKASISLETEQLISAIPTENQKAYDLYLRGRNAYEERDLKVAVHFYQQANELDSMFALPYVWMGIALADICYLNSTKEQINSGELLSWMKIFESTCDDTIMYFVNKALAINTDIPEAYYIRSIYWMRKGEDDKELSDLETATDLNPNHVLSNYRLGTILRYKERYIDAWRILRKTRKLAIGTPEYVDVLFRMGGLYLQIEYFDRAEELFRECINYKPLEAYSRLLTLSEVSIQWEKYKYYVDKVCELNSGFNCQLHLYYYATIQEDFELAQKYYDNCMEHEEWFGGLVNAQHRYGYVLDNLGKTEEARRNFDEQIKEYKRQISQGSIFESYGLSSFRLAAIYAYIGEEAKAIEMLKELERNGKISIWYKYLLSDPYFKYLKDNPELKEIIQRQQKESTKIRAEIDRLEAAGEL